MTGNIAENFAYNVLTQGINQNETHFRAEHMPDEDVPKGQ
jgi:hypothetical protein